MKKILLLISILISMTGGIVFYSQGKQDTPKLEQVNVSEKKAEEKVADEASAKENKSVEEITPEQNQEEVKEAESEVKSNSTPENKNTFSASKSENKQNKSVNEEVPKETPKTNNNTTTSSNNQNIEQPKNNVTTTFYDSITGGKKEFSSESEATARGTEIQNKELDYVLNYNEQHPEAPIQPDINYFRVYPSMVDENGQYWYYLHFFCVSGEGNDEKLKSIY